MIITTSRLISQFLNYKETSQLYSDVSKVSMTLQEASDYLTEESRFYVLSGDFVHLKNYFFELNDRKRRESSIEQLISLNPNKSVLDYFQKALEDSHNLEELEIYSMALVIKAKHLDEDPVFNLPEEIRQVQLKPEDEALDDEYKIAKAWIGLFSEDYMTLKSRISACKTNALNIIFNYTKNEQDTSFENLKKLFVHMIITITLIFIVTLLLFICIVLLIIKPLKSNIENIKLGNKLDKFNSVEFNILSTTYNEMYEKNEANEVLLRHRAEHDELTGLINRGTYKDILGALTSTKSKLALILIDVDLFKNINDTYGHPVGDKVLQFVAMVLKGNFRSSDYIARIGGDEFAVIVTDCNHEREIVEEMISIKLLQIKDTLSAEKTDIPPVTLSCGIEFSDNGYNEKVYEHADAALYKIKQAGRNGFAFYKED